MENRTLQSIRFIIVAAVILLSLAACSQASDERTEILVFAATSLTDALQEIEQGFEAQDDVDVAFNFGASQALAQQIASGAPADAFFSAGQPPVRYLDDRMLIAGEPMVVLSNSLVVVVQPDTADMDSLNDLNTEAFSRIAIVNPDLGPAGAYTRESLTQLGLWDALQGKLVISSDVRAALTYVQGRNADAAILYRTDAMTAPGLQVRDIVPPESHSPIEYPAAVIEPSQNKEQAEAFLEYLRGEDAKAIFRRHGFLTLD